ncbi:MAG: hypothetical protein JWM82_4420, partial [Myxococcales bacterium]|nr:hypothetical protein [Myxococcales bacterium]
MTPERWQRIKAVFAAALASERARRGPLVDELCAGEPSLHAEVRSLIAAHESTSGTDWLGARAFVPEPDFPGHARFTVESRLGAGGFGVVYRARDAVRGRAVALKILRARDAAGIVRFKREFRALADLSHPNLVRLHELFVEDERVFFTMELCEGRPLAEALRAARAGESPADRRRRTAATFEQLVDGVMALHAERLLHRDLKPSNVLVTGDDRVVILDFGLATDLNDVGAAPDAGVCGTPAYMAPEQFLAGASSAASDLYAVGVMLYETLAGRLPWEGELGGVVDAKAKAAPPRPEGSVDAAAVLGDLCVALLAPEPA